MMLNCWLLRLSLPVTISGVLCLAVAPSAHAGDKPAASKAGAKQAASKAGDKPAASKPGAPATSAPGIPTITRFERERGRMMLNAIEADLRKYYYDTAYHGLDIDRLFKSTNEAIDEAATANDLSLSVARPLLMLNDSHTHFLPPGRVARFDFGWDAQMIGDRCFVVAVEPGSDAEAQGLKRGDEIVEFSGDRPTRDTLNALYYVHRYLAPQTRTLLTIAHPGEKPVEMTIRARVTPGQSVTDYRSTLDSNAFLRGRADEAYLARHRMMPARDTLFWKMPAFDLGADEVRTKILREVRKFQKLVIDLRGNGGGAVETLQTLVGGLIGPETKIADVKARKPQQPMMAKKAGDVYDGTIFVLIDSQSASASELLARTLQLAGRAKILGDRSAGAVMESQTFEHMVGGDRTGVFFGTSITVADLIMTDGQSLEKNGVTPDEIVLPTAEDLASDRDPALARAGELCGLVMTPEAAGHMFPVEWHR
jgi:C-terminal processing protease CtpA/Prc